MGSFTQGTANVIMASIFPQATTSSLVPIQAGAAAVTSATTQVGFKIYNNVNTAGQVGIYSGNAANVLHRIDLVVGATTNNQGPGTNQGLTDANFNTAGTALQGSTTNGGTVTFPTFAAGGQYVGYKGAVMGDNITVAANSWTGWFIGTSGGLPAVTNNNQITFVTAGTGSTGCQAQGFVVTASSSTSMANPNGITTVIASLTGSQSVIIAYGDLNSYRTISANDTPVFTGGTGTAGWPTTNAISTSGAIVITLD